MKGPILNERARMLESGLHWNYPSGLPETRTIHFRGETDGGLHI